MKHPLWNNWRESFKRQTTCFFLGHKWKYSPSRKTEWWGNDEGAPYEVRKITGNHLFVDVAWWKAKCVRCRQKIRRDGGEIPEVWYRTQWNGLRAAWEFGLWWHIKANLRYNKKNRTNGRANYPWWVEALTFWMALNSAFAQYAVSVLWEWDIPGSWWVWSLDLEQWYYSAHDKYDPEGLAWKGFFDEK